MLPVGRPLLWVISGAARGVGKTHLAERLCRLLPGAVYAKQGTSRRRPGKAENFFTSDRDLDRFLAEASGRALHLVVESNALAKRREDAIIVFLDGSIPAARGLRPDAPELKAAAHLVVGTDQGPADWRSRLAGAGCDPSLTEGVIAILAEHQGWLRSRSDRPSLS
jgi:hypothetical protein